MSACLAAEYAAPDYRAAFESRLRKLDEIEKSPDFAAALRVYYKDHPWDFVSDWGMTVDPRNLERGQIASVPFQLWPRQRQYLEWVFAMWKRQERGLVEKSRDCGVTWLSVGFAVSMWCFWDNFTCRFGSRKEELVDRRGDMDSIFEKVWFFIDNLPPIFRPQGFTEANRAHMRIVNPANGAAITGEAGDNIGRGGRASIAFVDEAAFIEHQMLVDAALSQTTNCQIDISTPNGNGNPFYRKRMRFDGTDKVFVFDWRDDPRKNDAWYQRQKAELDDVTVAQEIDRDYNASAENVFLPAKWVKSAIDAHKKLGFAPAGVRVTGFDPADVGDAKGVVIRHGSVITKAMQKRDGDIGQAIPWAFEAADDACSDVLAYDADGMGAPAMKIALTQLAVKRVKIVPYHGSGAVEEPGTHQKRASTEKSNIDQFVNYRAQSWSWVRERFRKTHDAVERAAKGFLVNIDPEDLISIDSECGELVDLTAELSRPQRQFTPNGKIKVESKADMKKRGVQSPNLADALVMAMSIKKPADDYSTPLPLPPPETMYFGLNV